MPSTLKTHNRHVLLLRLSDLCFQSQHHAFEAIESNVRLCRGNVALSPKKTPPRFDPSFELSTPRSLKYIKPLVLCLEASRVSRGKFDQLVICHILHILLLAFVLIIIANGVFVLRLILLSTRVSIDPGRTPNVRI